MKTCVILLFSSVGNVAMSVPIVESVARLQTDWHFVVVSRKRLADMFYGLQNISFHTIQLDDKSVNFKKYLQLKQEIQVTYGRIDTIVDLQNDCHTSVCRHILASRDTQVVSIDRQRHAKHLLRLRGYKQSSPLRTAFDIYREAMTKAGLLTDDKFIHLPVNQQAAKQIKKKYGEKQQRWIGVAPFAKHRTNMLPFQTTKQVIINLTSDPNTLVFLFGAGKIESELLRQWATHISGCYSVAGELPLSEELELMRELDMMICMDSANQHLASLVGLRAITTWCGTHPYTGFYGWKQDPNDCLQRPLACRPCTNHGKDRCKYFNFLCQDLTASDILEKINKQ